MDRQERGVSMEAEKMIGIVDENGELHLAGPVRVRPGPAEVIVLPLLPTPEPIAVRSSGAPVQITEHPELDWSGPWRREDCYADG